MTTVSIDLRRGDFVTPAVGSIAVAPYRRIHVDGMPDFIVIPDSVIYQLEEGQVDIELEPNDGDWAWIITERVNNGITRYVDVPDTDEVLSYGDLVDINPTTFLPTAQPEAAWWAALENLSQPQSAITSVTVVTGDELRPVAQTVFWIGGAVQPANMANGDVWFEGEPIVPEPVYTAPEIVTANLTPMQVGSAFVQNLTATGDSPLMWQVVSGALPAGLTLSSTAIVSGTPTTAGDYTFEVSVTNPGGVDTQTYTGTVSAAPAPGTAPRHSVFTTPPVPINVYNDGGSLRVANGFITTATDYKLVGMRIFVPSGGNVTVPTSVSAHLYTPALGQAPVLLAPTETVQVTGLVEGWNSILFSTTRSLTQGTPFWVGYEFPDGTYLHAPLPGGEDAPEIPAADGSDIVYAPHRGVYAGLQRQNGYYIVNNYETTETPVFTHYGVDVIVEEG